MASFPLPDEPKSFVMVRTLARVLLKMIGSINVREALTLVIARIDQLSNLIAVHKPPSTKQG